MIKLTKRIDDSDGTVSKLIFEGSSSKSGIDVCVETVLYQYKDRIVVCFSTQYGCPVGCIFCGTGNKFVTDLSVFDMHEQISVALALVSPLQSDNSKPDWRDLSKMKVQLMPMSMGEPMLNWGNVKIVAESYLNEGFYFFISSVGINNKEAFGDILKLGYLHTKFGFQISLHCADQEKRLKLFRNKTLEYAGLEELTDFSELFLRVSGNSMYFNYIVTGKETDTEKQNLANIVRFGHLTCSVLCSTTKMTKTDSKMASDFIESMMSAYDVDNISLFDPAGQDTIGGGCGQLFYVQEKLKGTTVPESNPEQCDGCAAGYPVNEFGIHDIPYPSGPMVCTNKRRKKDELKEYTHSPILGRNGLFS